VAVVKGGTTGTAGLRVVRLRTRCVVVVRSGCVVLVVARRPLVVMRGPPPRAVVPVVPVATGDDGLVLLTGPTTGTAGFVEVGVVVANLVRVGPVLSGCVAGGLLALVEGTAEMAGPGATECLDGAGPSPGFLVVVVAGAVVADVCRRDVGVIGRLPGREGVVVVLDVGAGGSLRADNGLLPAPVLPNDGGGTGGNVVMPCPVGSGVPEPPEAVVPELSMPTAEMCLGELEPPPTTL
jgi:hypothetical protein